MSQAISYIKSESKIISLFLFLCYVFFIFPLVLLKNVFFSNWKLAFKTAAIISFSLAALFSAFLAFQLNREASERYLITGYEKNLSQLTKENQYLSVRFSKANSISGASDLAKVLNFEKVSRISYIKPGVNKIVKK